MAKKLDIINLALSRIGEDDIQSLTETSAVAAKCRRVYDMARQATLRDYDWSFARRSANLPPAPNTPTNHYKFAYRLPQDCLRVLCETGRIDNRENTGATYVIAGRLLYTDKAQMSIDYIADVTNADDFDPMFVDAFAYKLASELAIPVKGAVDLAGSYQNQYMALLQRAAAVSQKEEHEQIDDNPYETARFC